MNNKELKFNEFLLFLAMFDKFGVKEEIIEKRVLYAIDSKDKEDGIFNKYLKALYTEDNMLIPYNGTKVALEYMGISEEQWHNKLDN